MLFQSIVIHEHINSSVGRLKPCMISVYKVKLRAERIQYLFVLLTHVLALPALKAHFRNLITLISLFKELKKYKKYQQHKNTVPQIKFINKIAKLKLLCRHWKYTHY